MTEIKQIAGPRKRKPYGEYLQRQEELRQYIAEHPGATVREIATHFGKSTSTMQAWLDKLIWVRSVPLANGESIK